MLRKKRQVHTKEYNKEMSLPKPGSQGDSANEREPEGQTTKDGKHGTYA